MKKAFTIIGLIVLLLIVVKGCASLLGPNEEYEALAKARFDEVAEGMEGLDSIECYQGSCSSTVYFNFNALPEDLDMLIRSNTATFSSFKEDYFGVSRVTVIATLNGDTVLTCNANSGMVENCE